MIVIWSKPWQRLACTHSLYRSFHDPNMQMCSDFEHLDLQPSAILGKGRGDEGDGEVELTEKMEGGG